MTAPVTAVVRHYSSDRRAEQVEQRAESLPVLHRQSGACQQALDLRSPVVAPDKSWATNPSIQCLLQLSNLGLPHVHVYLLPQSSDIRNVTRAVVDRSTYLIRKRSVAVSIIL